MKEKIKEFFKWECKEFDSPDEIWSSWKNFKDNLFTAIIMFIICILCYLILNL